MPIKCLLQMHRAQPGKNYRITEFELKETFIGHLVQLPCNEPTDDQGVQTPSSLTLGVSCHTTLNVHCHTTFLVHFCMWILLLVIDYTWAVSKVGFFASLRDYKFLFS